MLSAFVLATALAAPAPGPELDFDRPTNEARSELHSPFLRDRLTVAMALPYAYGVTRMPCPAREWQPLRGWAPAREPSGRIRWSSGESIAVKWAGIYGTCEITSPRAPEALGRIERAALECECNGWLPLGIDEYPLP